MIQFNNETYQSLKGIKVLLVEDNKINQLIARRFLEKWDVEIDTADDGQMAVDKVKSTKYHLVLMDLQMPILDGYEATEQIRAFELNESCKLPIIALSASAMYEIKSRAFEVGVDDFITKPFHPGELYHMVQKYGASRYAS